MAQKAITTTEKPTGEEKDKAEKEATSPVEMDDRGQSQPETLPQLMGRCTTNLLAALQGNDAGAKQRAIADSIREMRIWYDAQPVDGRKESARIARKTLENFKLVAEQFFQEMMAISAQDAQ